MILDWHAAAFHKSKLLRLVIAEDLFAQCDSSVQDAKRAFVFGGHRWPGNDYIQPGNFVRWLHQHVPSAQKLLVRPHLHMEQIRQFGFCHVAK